MASNSILSAEVQSLLPGQLLEVRNVQLNHESVDEEGNHLFSFTVTGAAKGPVPATGTPPSDGDGDKKTQGGATTASLNLGPLNLAAKAIAGGADSAGKLTVDQALGLSSKIVARIHEKARAASAGGADDDKKTKGGATNALLSLDGSVGLVAEIAQILLDADKKTFGWPYQWLARLDVKKEISNKLVPGGIPGEL